DLARFLGHVLPGMHAVGVAGDRDDGDAAVQRFNQSGNEVGRAWAEGAITDARTICDARIGVGGKGAAAFVVDQMVVQADEAGGVVERQELEAAHTEHWPSTGQTQHLGESATTRHGSGRTVRQGMAHGFLRYVATARRRAATKSRALVPSRRPSEAARAL